MPPIISAEHLTRVFNGKLTAVSDVSFAVEKGETFGFLGPNGAGKTTTVSMLTANLAPTRGRAVVDGLDVAANPTRVKKRIGLVLQESSSDGELTGRENLVLAAGLFAVPRAEAKDRVEFLLDRMALGEAADRLVKTYSGGMRRRLELAVGIVHTPPVLFLDEPTLGLDPQGRAGFWQYVKELQKRDQLTVFVTTHYLDEADQLCDRIAIIDHGVIVATGSPSELKDRLGGDVVTLRPAGPGADLTSGLQSLPGVVGVSMQEGAYRIKCPAGETVVPGAVQVAAQAGVKLAAVSLKRPSLDEVFLEFTGREFREEEGPSATDWAVRVRHFQRARGR